MPMLSRYTGKTIITICQRSVVSVRRCAWHAAQQYLPQTFSITSSFGAISDARVRTTPCCDSGYVNHGAIVSLNLV